MGNSSDDEILIKIQTAYESGGIDAVKRALGDTESQVKKLGGANDELARKTATSNRELNNAQRAASALNAATSASRGSLLGLAQVFDLFGGKVGAVMSRVSLVVSAGIAGWKAGIPVGEKLWSTFVDGAAKAIVSVSGMSVAVKGLNDTDLSKIRAEVDKLAADTEKIAANIDRNTARREKLRSTDTAAKIAEVKASITNPEDQAKAIAAIQEEDSQNATSDQAKDALAKLLPAERQVKGIDAAIAKLTAERAAAKTAMDEVTNMSPVNPERRARRERFSRAETVVAKDISALSTQRESAYQTYLDRQADFQSASKNVDTTATSIKADVATRVRDSDKAKQDAILAAKSTLVETQLGLATTPAAKAALTRQLAGIQGQQIESDTTAPSEAIALRKSALGLQTSKALAERVGGAKYQKYQSLESDAEQQQREADAARGRIGIYQSALQSAHSPAEVRKQEQNLSSAKTDYSKEVAEANAARAAAAAALKEVSSALRDIGADINILRDQFKNRDN